MKEKNHLKSTYGTPFLYRYGLGEFGFTFFLFFISYYLMYYMTDVLCLPMGLASIIYTTVQWFEGITMLAAGVLIDRVNLKLGKYRPWMLLGAIICSVSTVLFFTNFHLSATANAVLFTIFYFLAYSGYNLMWVAYRSMIGPMSRNPQDNVSLTTASSQMGTLAGFVFSLVGAQILYGFSSMQTGYTVSALLWGVVMVGGILISSFSTRKFDNLKTQVKNSTQEKVTLQEMLRSFNGPMIVFFIAVAFRESIATFLPTLLIYYFKIVVGNEGWLSIYLVVINVSALIGYFFARLFANRFGKKAMFMTSCFCSVGCIVCIALTNGNIYLFMALMALHTFCSIFSGSMIPAFMNEIADYNEVERGNHARSFVISLGGTAIRVAAILGGGLASIGLSTIGYQANLAVTDAFRGQLTNLMIWGSAIMLFCSGVVFALYKLDEKEMERIYKKRGESMTFGS